jgi:hypothetical protein
MSQEFQPGIMPVFGRFWLLSGSLALALVALLSQV